MAKFEKTHDAAILPTRGTARSAGYDFYTLLDHSFDLAPGETVLIPTGVTVQLADDEWLELKDRSGLSLKASLGLGGGVIDADYYPNPIGIILHNLGKLVKTIGPRERIAQGIIQKYITTDNDQAEGERQGGFGSTGLK